MVQILAASPLPRCAHPSSVRLPQASTATLLQSLRTCDQRNPSSANTFSSTPKATSTHRREGSLGSSLDNP
ncbi:hypothetical protein BS78_K320700 [Paspalum vaginatum]|uniref:Uncharacterized protein n=1 Tax=Paspalum vaginatum TaxID=158149 RepID=A0A9W8CFZ3_9POAL|nr:hypothetical protein BS78_K320700 [Paspalum vaginatum]